VCGHDPVKKTQVNQKGGANRKNMISEMYKKAIILMAFGLSLVAVLSFKRKQKRKMICVKHFGIQ
jgi:hypothetical protein